MTDYNVNADIATKTLKECIKTTSQFGTSIYHNICDGSIHVVPWGGDDWVLAIFLYSFGFGVICLLFAWVWFIIFGDSM